MADEKIDSLTIGIGLTTEEFQAGIDKIMEGISGMRQSTEAAAEGMGASFAAVGESVAGLAGEFAAMFIAVRSIEDVVGYLKGLSSELASLAFAGEYLGQSSVQLSRFGEVSRLAGGQAQDAIAAVQGLQSAIFGLEYQGQMTQNLLMLNRLRVAYLDERGHMLPIEQIAMNAAKALQQQLPGKANEAMRVQWAAQIFGPGGLANAVGGGVAELRKFYAESTKDQKSITQRAMDEQRHLQQSITRLSYDVKNEATKALNALTPVIQALINEIRNGLIPTIDEVITDITHPISQFEKKHPEIGSVINRSVDTFHQFMRMLEEPFKRRQIEAKQIPAEVMGRIPSDIAKNPDALRVLKIFHFEAGGDTGDPTWSKAITNYIGFYGDDATRAEADYKRAVSEGRAGVISRPGTPASPSVHVPPTPATPGATRPGASHIQNNNSSNVTIKSLTVNAPNARDPKGIMGASRATWEKAASESMQRKLLAAQADPGMQ